MTIYSMTDTGKVRSSNQDSLVSGQFDDGAWGVVCDGMGGANGGDIASAKATGIIGELLAQRLKIGMTGSEIRQLFDHAVDEANDAVLRESLDNPALFGMGTTVVMAVAVGDTLYAAHAGDSRAYLIDKDRITCLTRDHSIVQELVDHGRLTQDEARNHPRRNIITRALGVYESVSVDHTECGFESGMLLLCSDGLTNCLDDSELLRFATNTPVDKLCQTYIEQANENGGQDNITALIISK